MAEELTLAQILQICDEAIAEMREKLHKKLYQAHEKVDETEET